MRFGFFCKSFRRDVTRVEKLVASIERHVAGDVAGILSVPRADLALFRDRIGSSCLRLVSDEEIVGKRLKQNWRTQQLVKLYAHRLGFADLWLVLDSDMAFIRDVGASDFVDETGSVALVASRWLHLYDRHETELREYVRGQRELGTLSIEEARSLADGARPDGEIPLSSRLVDAVWSTSPEARIARIRATFPRSGPELFYLPAAVWTRESLRSLETDYLEPRGLTFDDLIRHSPWEGTWVGEWELRRRLPGRWPAESFFLHFASDDAIERARAAGLTTADFAKRYVGLQLAAGHQAIEAY
ncbi:MAG TPA: DUF6492 family protein [Polyangiaceae bacterium]|nr:DUF6492 family protein [Polyangiaceae bacterium]